jgi:hypothetical protein
MATPTANRAHATAEQIDREVLKGAGVEGEVVGPDAAPATTTSDGRRKLPVPDPERLLFWGGLGTLGVIGVLEWPVTIAVGAGWLYAERLAARRPRPAKAG